MFLDRKKNFNHKIEKRLRKKPTKIREFFKKEKNHALVSSSCSSGKLRSILKIKYSLKSVPRPLYLVQGLSDKLKEKKNSVQPIDSLKELKQSSSVEQNLIPLPKDILRFTLFSYLEESDSAELAMHPQFGYIYEYQSKIPQRHEKLQCLSKAIAYNSQEAEIILQNYPQLKYDALWLATAFGNQNIAKNIIKEYPEWLFKTNTIQDLSFRKIENVTLLELAYGADDLDMFEMILNFLDNDGRNTALEQIQKQFTELSKDEPYNWNFIVNAINANNVLNIEEVKEVKEVLEKFRKDFAPKTIKKGQKHFDIENLMNAFEVFNDNYDKWSSPQCTVFSNKVIGYLSKMLPACYAQAFIQGFANLTVRRESLERNLKWDKHDTFYPSEFDSSSEKNNEIGICGGWPCTGSHGKCHAVEKMNNYVRQKIGGFTRLGIDPNKEQNTPNRSLIR